MDVVNIISQVGFPIAISLYLLIRFENTIKNNTKAIIILTEKIKR